MLHLYQFRCAAVCLTTFPPQLSFWCQMSWRKRCDCESRFLGLESVRRVAGQTLPAAALGVCVRKKLHVDISVRRAPHRHPLRQLRKRLQCSLFLQEVRAFRAMCELEMGCTYWSMHYVSISVLNLDILVCRIVTVEPAVKAAIIGSGGR